MGQGVQTIGGYELAREYEPTRKYELAGEYQPTRVYEPKKLNELVGGYEPTLKYELDYLQPAFSKKLLSRLFKIL